MQRRTIVLAFLLLSVTACHRGGNADGGDAQPARPDSIFVAALNEHFYDARVHAVYDGGQRRSLGTIPGNGGRSLTALPWEPRALIFEISFVIGGTAYISQPLDVTRGERVDLTLPPNIDESGFFRRVRRS
jgi:hypothetical protein